MKIAITAEKPDITGNLDPRFGRCAHFIIVETQDMSFNIVENVNNALSGGAGIQAAQIMAQHDVKAVLTGNCGPNAHQTLQAAGIEVFTGLQGSITEIIEQFKAGELQQATTPNVASHAGMMR